MTNSNNFRPSPNEDGRYHVHLIIHHNERFSYTEFFNISEDYDDFAYRAGKKIGSTANRVKDTKAAKVAEQYYYTLQELFDIYGFDNENFIVSVAYTKVPYIHIEMDEKIFNEFMEFHKEKFEPIGFVIAPPL